MTETTTRTIRTDRARAEDALGTATRKRDRAMKRLAEHETAAETLREEVRAANLLVAYAQSHPALQDGSAVDDGAPEVLVVPQTA